MEKPSFTKTVVEFLYQQGADGASIEMIKRSCAYDLLDNLFMPVFLGELIQGGYIRQENSSYYFLKHPESEGL